MTTEPASIIREGTPEEVQARTAANLMQRGFRLLVDDRLEGVILARYHGSPLPHLDCGTLSITDPDLPPLVVPAASDRLVYGLERASDRLVESYSQELNALLTIRFRHYAAALAPSTRISAVAEYALVTLSRSHTFNPQSFDGLGTVIAASGRMTRFGSFDRAAIEDSNVTCVPLGNLEWTALRG